MKWYRGGARGEQEVADIEESVWAPKYGIKGNIDATLMVAFGTDPQQQRQQQNVHTPGQQQQPAVLAPFEFKTGKPHHSHRAQVTLPTGGACTPPRLLGCYAAGHRVQSTCSRVPAAEHHGGIAPRV